MTMLELQRGIVYGPVNSRRLGRSLGVNLLPTRHKLCSFDCIYCHYGRTKELTLHPEASQLPDVGAVVDAVREGLTAHPDVQYITFSGNGEPTLHPEFSALVTAMRQLRDEMAPRARLALLSNSTMVHDAAVQGALSLLDAPIMKLDAGDDATLQAISRPAPGVTIQGILEGLKSVPNLIVQSVLVDGPVTNAKGDPFEAWLAALAAIRPKEVQIYSTDRPVARASVERVPPEMLEDIRREVEARVRIPVRAYWA